MVGAAGKPLAPPELSPDVLKSEASRKSQSPYFGELCRAMSLLAEHPATMFMGQAVCYPGTAMFRSLMQVDEMRRMEIPVAEDMQLGMAIGMSLNGHIPITIYPRVNFLLLAMSQLVLHLDRLPVYSRFRPRVIIRTAVATDKPLNPGEQHLGDFTHAIEGMLENVRMVRLDSPEQIVPGYQEALNRAVNGCVSTILVEYAESYE